MINYMKKYLTIIVIVVLILLGIYFIASKKCLSSLQVVRFTSTKAMSDYITSCRKPSVVLELFK